MMVSRAAGTTQAFSRNTVLLTGGLFLLMARILFWIYQNPVLGHDQYSLLWEARRLLGGAELYGPRLSEPNPPFIIWFSVLPAAASRLVHLTETSAFQLLVLGMIAASTLWSLRIARNYGVLADRRLQLLLALSVLAIESPLRTLLYGQRENLLIVCLLPYALALALDRMETLPRIERIAVGIAAGCGVCFKPHHVLVIMGLEVAVAALRRSLRHLLSAELAAATLTCVMYVAAIRLLTPRYLTEMVPLLRDTYWALGSHSALYLALHQLPETGCVLLLAIMAVVLLKQRGERDAILILLFGAMSASLAYDVQHTDWGYHLYPALALIAMSGALLLLLKAGPLLIRYDASRSLPATVGVLILLVAFIVQQARVKPDPQMPNDAGVFAGLTKGDTVYIFSTGAELFTIAYRRDLEWGSRFPCLWILPAIVQNSPGGRAFASPDMPFKPLTPERIEALSNLQRSAVAEDLERWKPKVVVVQKCPCDFMYSDRFDMLRWFGEDSGFVRSWSHYTKQVSMPGIDIYRRAPG